MKSKNEKKSSRHHRSISEQVDNVAAAEKGEFPSSSSTHRRTKSSVVASFKSFVNGKTSTQAKHEGTSSEQSVSSNSKTASISNDLTRASKSVSSSVFRGKKSHKGEKEPVEWLIPETLNSFDQADAASAKVLEESKAINGRAAGSLNEAASSLLLSSIASPEQVLTQYIFEMRQNPLDRPIQIKGCKGLGNIAATMGIPPDLSHEVTSVIICAMRTFPNKSDVQVAACQALRRCSAKVDRGSDKSNPQLPVEEPETSPSVIRLDRHICKEIVETGILNSVLKAMSQFRDCRDLQREGIRVLRHSMSLDNAKTKQIISELCGVEIIISAMWSFGNSSVVQEDGSILIWSLAFDDLHNQSLILQNNGIGAIINAMATFADSEAVQRFATGGLHALSSDEDACLYILDNGGVQVIMQAIQKFGHLEDIVEKSLSTVANVAVSNEDSVIFSDEDVPVLKNVVELHLHMESIRKIGCYLLETIKREKGIVESDDPELHYLLRQASVDTPTKSI